MDSLTQFALGAGVGLAVLGPSIGPRKAAITGGLLGTLPDLDVLFPFDDPVDSFILHRGASHSFFIHALVTPLFGEALLRLFDGLKGQRLRAYLAVFLIFVTHAVIDALTIYGTRIFWPIYPEPVKVGSIFIIDPLYTLPLLAVVIWAFFKGSWTRRFGRFVTGALIVSTAYLGLGLVAQQIARERAEAYLAEAQIQADDLIAIATPFNIVFWKAIAIVGDRYVNLYLPLLGGPQAVTAYVHPRGDQDPKCLEGLPALQKLAGFSDGFYRVDRRDGDILVSDLRMGLTPNYAFTFAIAQDGAGGPTAMVPERRPNQRQVEGDWPWLLAGIGGDGTTRPAEAPFLADLAVEKSLRVAAGSAATHSERVTC